jgi:GNAT superfamily N-acetyltransferase
MFADSALAARIDRAEARLSAGVAEAIHARRPDYRTIVMPLSGGLAVYAAPSSPVNKVIGIGFDGPLDLDALAAIEEEWRARGEAVRFELSVLADPSAPVVLSERGYHVHGYEVVLGRPLGVDDERDGVERGGVTMVDETGASTVIAPAASSDLTIEPLRAEDESTWIDVAVTAFTNLDGSGSAADDSIPSDDLREALNDFSGAPGFRRYLARAGGKPVGAASLRIDGDLAQVAGAGTLPSARGRGVQKALLARRLADAREAGATLAVVTTSPGTRSQSNVMRRGFILLYTRIILVKRWTSGS